jgi:hypothetical protein
MTYDEALAIAAKFAPELKVMPPFPDHPDLFAVERPGNSTPFSINLPNARIARPDLSAEQALKEETTIFKQALEMAKTS